MIAGFFCIYKTDWFLRNMGDPGEMFGVYNASWASWKSLGLFLMIIGFAIAVGLLQIIFFATIGRLFTFGGL